MPHRKLIIDSDAEGCRLDQFLGATGIWPSRTFVQKVIAAGGVRFKGKVLWPSFRLEPGYEIEVLWDDPVPLNVAPEAIPLEILYEDHDLVVVNKPRGMVVHPAAGNYHGTMVNALLEHCRDLSGIGGKIRPGIVHRLDKDTSGVLVVAKNDFSHLALAAQIKSRTMKRVYKTLVHGTPPENGRIEAPIGRHPTHRKKMAVIPTGKTAVTNYRVLEFLGPYAFLEVKLESGRTHQIRVHLSYLGYPVVGDPVYGRRQEKVPIQGQALHAAILGFTHPRTGEYLEFAAEIPEVMKQALEWCRRQSR
jgi:23S rRNA pseudouridine1911/1915/1917 synthase